MDQDDIKAILDRVLTWPVKRQKDAARLLAVMEETDASPYHLTEAQAAEVRHRIAAEHRTTLTIDQIRQHLERCFGGSSGDKT